MAKFATELTEELRETGKKLTVAISDAIIKELDLKNLEDVEPEKMGLILTALHILDETFKKCWNIENFRLEEHDEH